MPNSIVFLDVEKLKAVDKKPGWVAGADGHLFGNSKVNTHFVHIMHVNDKGVPMYDQIMRAEVGGGVILPVDMEGRIGLQEAWRMQTQDQEAWEKSYPKMDLTKVGRVSYELCGGFAKAGESGMAAAKREGQEESQSAVVSQEKLGYICDNRASSLHLGTLSWGRIDATKKPKDKPDPNEAILAKLKFFTFAEVAALQREGKLYDAFTLSAIGSLFLQHPELFMKASEPESERAGKKAPGR